MESLNRIAKDLKKNEFSFRKKGRRPNDLKSLLMRQPHHFLQIFLQRASVEQFVINACFSCQDQYGKNQKISECTEIAGDDIRHGIDHASLHISSSKPVCSEFPAKAEEKKNAKVASASRYTFVFFMV